MTPSPSLRARSRFLTWCLPVAGLLAALAPISPADIASAWSPGTQVGLSPWLSPDPSISTSGDFATDTFSDPWDFSNAEDFETAPGVGASLSEGASIANGVLTVTTHDASSIRLLMKWPGVRADALPWGRDGWAHPIDASRYSQVDLRIRADINMGLAVRWWNAAGATGVVPFNITGGDWHDVHLDLTDRSKYIFPGSDAVWGGPVVWFELFRGGAGVNNPPVNVQLDWVRLRRPDASPTPPANVPVPRVISPNETGGADYATVERGNPWDFNGMDDVGETHDVANLAINANGDLTGVTTGNDPFISFPLDAPLNSDRYHRLTLDVCYDGIFDLNGYAGGGMMGRVAWMPEDDLEPAGSSYWTETQDFMAFPGCHSVSLDMVTTPAEAIHDQDTANPVGWRGHRMTALRFDLNEDPGVRGFTLRNVKLADDAAFSTNFPITFDGATTPGTKADIFVTTTRAGFNGTRIATQQVGPGINTFTWTGVDAQGTPMPNGTYWVYVVMTNTAGTGVGYSTGPVRLERYVPPTASYYVPLTPARLLDTRSGVGGNLSPIGQQWSTELDVTGVGGVPETNVTAVVMNVTVAEPTAPGFLTAWPSGEDRPLVSSLNFIPGQTVPNLVTVKVGANGRVNLFNSTGRTHVIADVAGYYTPVRPASGGRFTALTPTRLLDTRSGTGTGGVAAPIGQGQAIQLGVTGVGGVPATGVDAVALNVTVDQPTAAGFLTVWPNGVPQPTASTHNFGPGLTVANLVLAKVGANGQVSIFNSAGSTHVVADVVGYFSAAGGLFVPVTPRRLVDSREATQMGTADTHTMDVTGSPVPDGAKAVVVNVTSVNSSINSFITVWPTAADKPVASTLNPRPGVAVPNQAYLGVGTKGSLDAFNASGSTDIIVDVFGYIM